MRKIKLNILQIFMLLFCVSTFTLSCTQRSNEIENSSLSTTKPFEFYANNANSLKKHTIELFKKADKPHLKTMKEIDSFLFSNIANSQYGSIEYLDINFYKNIKSINRYSDVEITIEDTGLSEKTINYFNQLVSMNETKDFSGMINLLNQYKVEYNSDPHLESLAGVFSMIDVYQDDLSNRFANKNCEGDGAQLAGAAIGGAILGARVGFIFGSFLGPAGSVAGTIGGAIVGGILSGIMNIGAQAITNCGGNNEE
jgi:hypothetical protein